MSSNKIGASQSGNSLPQNRFVQVDHVLDGDTVALVNFPAHIRMYGIDAPEKKQQYGPQAKTAMESLLGSPSASKSLIFVQTQNETTYKRLVGKLLVGIDKKDVSLEMVRNGHAWAYLKYIKKRSPDYEIYRKAQEDAQRERLGLWAFPNPENPEQFRHNRTTRKNQQRVMALIQDPYVGMDFGQKDSVSCAYDSSDDESGSARDVENPSSELDRDGEWERSSQCSPPACNCSVQ